MSIFSDPFPVGLGGAERCSDTTTARLIIICALAADGRDTLGQELEKFLDWKTVGTEDMAVQMPEIKLGVGIPKLRKPVEELWKKMSKRAKARFLSMQYHHATQYLDKCVDAIRQEIGQPPKKKYHKPIELPTSGDLIDPNLLS